LNNFPQSLQANAPVALHRSARPMGTVQYRSSSTHAPECVKGSRRRGQASPSKAMASGCFGRRVLLRRNGMPAHTEVEHVCGQWHCIALACRAAASVRHLNLSCNYCLMLHDRNNTTDNPRARGLTVRTLSSLSPRGTCASTQLHRHGSNRSSVSRFAVILFMRFSHEISRVMLALIIT
jgi:hypothetical protein